MKEWMQSSPRILVEIFRWVPRRHRRYVRGDAFQHEVRWFVSKVFWNYEHEWNLQGRSWTIFFSNSQVKRFVIKGTHRFCRCPDRRDEPHTQIPYPKGGTLRLDEVTSGCSGCFGNAKLLLIEMYFLATQFHFEFVLHVVEGLRFEQLGSVVRFFRDFRWLAQREWKRIQF